MFLMLENCNNTNAKGKAEVSLAPTLASTGEQLTRQEVIDRQLTRGLKSKTHYVEPDDIEAEGSRRKRKR